MVNERYQRLASTLLTKHSLLGAKGPQYSRAQWNPDITISRDSGSGGRIIAKRLAKKLGWEYYDKRILKKLAKEMDMPEKIIEKIDEHPRPTTMDIVQSWLNPNYISDYAYIHSLKKVLLKAGQKGDVVILGRGANHIIPIDKALHVRVTAPFSTRVANLQKYEKMSKSAAIEYAEKSDLQRQQFIKQYFGCDQTCCEHVDISINTATLRINNSVELIIEAFKRKFA